MSRGTFVLCARYGIVLVAAFTAGESFGAVPSFQGLGFLPGSDESYANDISGDGFFVVGESYSFSDSSLTPAYRWDFVNGVVSVVSLPGGDDQPSPPPYIYDAARGVNADGSVVVGSRRIDPGLNPLREAYRWDEATGRVGLGYLSGHNVSSAQSVSGDGSIVVGYGYHQTNIFTYGPPEAFKWDAANGMVGLGYLPGYATSTANAISADGSTVVGSSASDFFNSVPNPPPPIDTLAVKWDDVNGIVSLGDLPGGKVSSFASAVNADGSVIVGSSSSAASDASVEAFRWDPINGMVGLGDLPGGFFTSYATGVSADGLVVVGWGSTDNFGTAPFIWDAVHGMRNLEELLISLDVDLTGWGLFEATGVSADGRTIIGTGVGPSGTLEAWIAHIPEPASFSLLALSGLALLAHRR